MSIFDLICLRCRRHIPTPPLLDVPVKRGPEDCVCVHPRPSQDGENLEGFPPGFDWRRYEYTLALEAGRPHRSGSGESEVVGQRLADHRR